MKPIEENMISRYTTDKEAMPRVHYHETHELYYLVKGNATYYIGDKIYHVHAGDFVFVPKGILHKTAYEHTDDNERIVLNFGDQLFNTDLQDIKDELLNSRILYIEKEHLPYFENKLKQIESEDTHKDGYHGTMMNLYVTELLVLLCRYKYNFTPALSGTDQAIYAISKYIRTHYHEAITLDRLSHEFAMSESHLSRKFKNHTGLGINEYITYVRVTNAEKLLRETELSITEIAVLCGYNDSNYFSTVFKRVKGIPPRKIRKQG